MTSYYSLTVTLAVSATVLEIFTLEDRKLLILPTPALFDAFWRRNAEQYQRTYKQFSTGANDLVFATVKLMILPLYVLQLISNYLTES